MRKFLIPLLMASAIIPAAAQADDGGFVRGIRSQGERSEKSDNSSNDRPQRAERSQRVERSDGDAPRVRVERAERPERANRPARIERSVEAQGGEPVRVRRFEGRQAVEPAQQARRIERRRDRDGDGFVDGIRRVGSQEVARQDGSVVTRHDRDGDRQWDGNRDGDRRWDGNRDGDRRWDRNRDGDRRWSRDWRRDGRYNWYSYRNRYSSLFRLGRYYDPYRYGYRRFSIGFSLWPSYYSSRYWLNDPWQYRLPPAYGPYRWVRYYDDALLVNTYSGEVVDVIYNFFW